MDTRITHILCIVHFKHLLNNVIDIGLQGVQVFPLCSSGTLIVWIETFDGVIAFLN